MYGRLSPESLGIVYDFTRCVRPNGTAYGTGGTCRKGTEKDKEEPDKQPRSTKAKLSKNENIAVDVMRDKSLKSDRKRIAEMVSRGVPSDTDFILLVSEAKRKLGLGVGDTLTSPVKSGPEAKTQEPTEKKKRGPEPGGMRITTRIKALSAEDLKRVMNDPRLKPNQRKVLEDLLASKSQDAVKPSVDSKPPKAKPRDTVEEPSAAPKRVSDEQLKKSFDKSYQRYLNLENKKKELSQKGLTWNSPEIVKVNRTMDRLIGGMDTMRQAHYAVNREEFLKAAAEESLLRKKQNKLEDQARRAAEGRSIYTLPKNHPAQKLWAAAEALRVKANGLPHEKKGAAYYGEPVNIGKPKSDGGGKVSPSVPSSLPKGGASKDLKDFLDGAEVVMAFSSKGFAKFVKEGQAKNGFEAGTGGVKVGRAKSYLEGRRKGEEKVLGLPETTESSRRPVYAALEHPDRTKSLQGGSPNMMSQYGGIQIVAKPSVKDRASFTVGDSLDGYSPRSLVASPVRDPANPSRVGGVDKTVEVNTGGGVTSSRFNIRVPSLDEDRKQSVPYVETQIFGGLNLTDVREVRYYKGSEIPPATLKLLSKAGIPVVELPPQMKSLKFYSSEKIPNDITAINPNP